MQFLQGCTRNAAPPQAGQAKDRGQDQSKSWKHAGAELEQMDVAFDWF